MKKLILTILLISLCISYTNFTVLARVKFGNWSKWDQQLPDINNKYWSWTFPGEKSTTITIEGKLLLITTYLYFGTSKNRASVIFYSPASQKAKIKKDYIPDPKFALVCFPPKKKKSIIRVYEIKNIEKSLSQFLEEWEIPFNQHQDGVPPGVKFRENFKKWLDQQAPSEVAESLKTMKIILPRLKIDNKGKFTLVPPILDDFVNIVSVIPSSELIDGMDTNFKVVVKYNLFSSNEGLLQVAFNNQESINSIRFVKDAHCIVYKGDGAYEFNVTVKPKNWGNQGDFNVLVTLDEIPQVSNRFLATDVKILTFK
jgi:hypothetical protein